MARPPLTRAGVVARARTLVRSEGAGRVSLRSVARSLGVTAPALYAHVADYDDLLAAVAEGEFARLRERFDAVDEDDPLDRLRALGRAYVEHARAEPHLHRLMFRYPPKLAAAGVPISFGPATDAFTFALTDGGAGDRRRTAGGGRRRSSPPWRCGRRPTGWPRCC